VKRMVRHEANFGQGKQTASMVLLVVMAFLAVWLPMNFLQKGMFDHAAGVIILAPSLIYTSLLASATKVSSNQRWFYRIIGLLSIAFYLAYFSVVEPVQALNCLLAAAGIIYCFLVDVLSPSCTGELSSLRKLLRENDPTRIIKSAGRLPDGLVADPDGSLWGTPTSAGHFELHVWDQKARALRDVIFDVTVAVPYTPRTDAKKAIVTGPGNKNDNKPKKPLTKNRQSRAHRNRGHA
jgi:hypothetical protein